MHDVHRSGEVARWFFHLVDSSCLANLVLQALTANQRPFPLNLTSYLKNLCYSLYGTGLKCGTFRCSAMDKRR
jgi:hypothetical protein